MPGWLLAAIAAAVLAVFIFIYNRLVEDAQHVKSGWSDIDVQLKRRRDLIPKLVAAVKQYAAYEQATLDNVTSLRNQAQQLNAVSQQADLEKQLSKSLLSIFALQESYPELKANQSFLQLQSEISEVENAIQFARRYYNGAVRNLNTRIDSFPDLMLARLFNYQAAEYFELSKINNEN